MVQRLNRTVNNIKNDKNLIKSSNYLTLTKEEILNILEDKEATSDLLVFLLFSIEKLTSK